MGTTKMVSGHMLITKTTWLFFIHYRHLLGVNHGFTLRLTVGDLYSFLPSKYFRQKRDIYDYFRWKSIRDTMTISSLANKTYSRI